VLKINKEKWQNCMIVFRIGMKIYF
jgi:hypothetical protein